MRWYMSRIAPLQMAGSAEKIVLVATDITERKRLEAQLLQAQKVESIGRLAGGVAHDFNNLLTSIVGFAELAKVGLPKDSRNVQNLSRVLESANRGATLTQQLLAFARKRIVKPEVLDLNQVIEGMVPMLKRLIGEDLEFAFIPGEKLDRIRIDPGSVEQVVMNLAVNARDAMPAGGTLTLETQNVLLDRAYASRHVDVTPGPYVMLSVTDTGSGMSKDVLTKIFEPFFTTKPVGKGTGLGLAMCHGIVTQAAGHISVTSEKGKGACFKVYLPRMKDAPATAASKRPVAEPKGGLETILAVEDDDLIRDFLGQTLRGLGYKVHLAANGEEALRLCEELKEPIHLLLTDVVMPKMSGRDLAAILQARQRNLKILFASGYTEDDTIRKGELNPNMDFIQKPYNSTSLAAQIRGILDR
jgi:signal transduction histidine kinase